MMDWVDNFLARATPGTPALYAILIVLLLGVWKGLPAVLDAWTNRLSEERNHREREIARLERQIKDADDRHAECLEGQKTLREEVNRLQGMLSAMVIQMRQIQLSATNLGIETQLPPAFMSMLEGIDKKAAKS